MDPRLGLATNNRGYNPFPRTHSALMLQRSLISACVVFTCSLLMSNPSLGAETTPRYGVVDLSVLVSPNLPCAWPVGMTQYLLTSNRVIGPGPFHRDMVMIDEHTGTQWDAPAHFIPPPDSGLPGAGPMGLITSDKVPVWQFVGEACVIDVTRHVDDAKPGHSFLITPEIVQAWEQEHRKLGAGDVVLFHSGYTDRYYKPFPEGERLVHHVLANKTPGWAAPTPQCMKLLGERGVWAAGTDGASIGPVPDLAAATHQAGGQYGLIWTENATSMGKLPPTGSFHAIMAAFHAGGSGTECRAIAITEPKLAADLLKRARAKQVVDLSVLLDEELPVTWAGASPGDEATRYLGKTLNNFSAARGPSFVRGHVLDSQVGTHVVAPAYSLPPKGFDSQSYSPEVRTLLAEFEKKWGKRGTSDQTIEKLPLEAMLGPARVIDVSSVLGTTSEGDWPASPMIALEHVQKHEADHGPIAAGDVVIFRCGYSDAHLQALPEGKRLMADPLIGKAEGWPTPELAVIDYLAKRGVRCVGTDAPTLGGVRPSHAIQTYWLAAGRGMLPVEFLKNCDKLPAKGAFFIFAPIKLDGAHGGYGRAIALK